MVDEWEVHSYAIIPSDKLKIKSSKVVYTTKVVVVVVLGIITLTPLWRLELDAHLFKLDFHQKYQDNMVQ